MLEFKPTLSFALLLLLIPCLLCYQSPSSCLDSQFYNPLVHSCQACPTGSTRAPDPTYCNCSSTHYRDIDAIGFMTSGTCLTLGGLDLSDGVSIVAQYDRTGAPITHVKVPCVNAYPNSGRNQCIPCGNQLVYDPTIKLCICSAANSYPVNGYCVSAGSLVNPFLTGDKLSYLLYGIGLVGCTASNPSQQPCQILVNKCAEAAWNGGDNFCILLTSKVSAGVIGQNLATGDSLTVSLNVSASSVEGADTATVKNKLNFIVFQYSLNGQLIDIKPLGPELLTCISNQQDAVRFQSFGLNLDKTCSSSDLQQNTAYYDIYVLDSKNQYVQVYTSSSASSYYRRHYKNPTAFNSISIKYQSTPPLTVPSIALSQQSAPRVATISGSDTINLTLLAPFIVFNIAIAVVFIIHFYRYTKYNPDDSDPYFCFKVLLLFFLKAIRFWGVGLWIWLLGVSMYGFCFFKFQQTVFLMLPDIFTQWNEYYNSFMIVYYLQFGFVFFSVLMLIYDLSTSTDYFMIDWEKQKNMSNYGLEIGNNKREISVWRKVLLVNQLYELTISSVTNVYLTVVAGIFFLDGLEWINLSYQVPNIANILQQSKSVSNVVLAYFIITFVFFVIFTIQYILRYAIKTWSPLPHENFVDLCCISNISLIIFDHVLHGYYIHGMNPLGQAEGSLQYIQSIFDKEAKSYGKSRAFKNDDPDQIQTFQVIFPPQIRQAFQTKYKTPYLQKLVGRAYDVSVFTKPIPDRLNETDYQQIQNLQNDMLDSFKHYLQQVKTSQFNVQDRSFLSKLISCPPDMSIMGRLPIFLKDYWNQFTEVMLSGYEVTFTINTINFINIFYIATKSVTISCLITMVICHLVLKNLADFILKRNISKNTLIDDKFFN